MAFTSNNLSVVNPLSIILVKNGSKGDRLLFRYPYKHERVVTSPPSTRGKDYSLKTAPEALSISQPRSRKISDLVLSPPLLDTSGELIHHQHHDSSSLLSPNGVGSNEGGSRSFSGTSGSSGLARSRKVSRTSPASLFGNLSNTIRANLSSLRSPYILDKSGGSGSDVFLDGGGGAHNNDLPFSGRKRFSPGDNEMLSELSDKDLSNLLAVNTDLSERKFELKLNYVRFVGHPTLMHHPKDIRPINPLFQTSVRLFNIVFCLEAVASHSIVKCFHDLSKRLGIALRHEEYRCGFLNQEMKTIIALHDEACTVHTDNKDEEQEVNDRIFDEILAKSRLAQLLKRVFDDVISQGCTFVRVNNWVQISFCLPQKIHTLPFRTQAPLVEPEAIHRCLEAIRPYHALLLLVDPDELIDSLWLDASSTIPRVLQVYSPLKSLQTLAADADLTLSHVMEIASHLVYWAQATVIYPLCETNIYVISPDFPITSPELRKAFEEAFPGLSLSQTLAQFSLPMPLGERVNPVAGGKSLQAQQVHIVTWFLKSRLLTHLHTYVYLTTYFDGSMMENGMDYLTAFTGDPDGSTRLSLHIRPYEIDEDDVTASDTFSETTTADDVGVGGIIASGADADLELASTPDTNGGIKLDAKPKDEVDEGENSSAKFKAATSELSEAVKRAVSVVKNALTVQDIKMFSRLSKYFTGDFHLEEIMYRENVRRSQLMLLLDKFRDVLITVEKEDAEINFFKF